MKGAAAHPSARSSPVPEPGATGGSPWSRYAGWIAGMIVVVGVMAFGAVTWFTYHP